MLWLQFCKLVQYSFDIAYPECNIFICYCMLVPDKGWNSTNIHVSLNSWAIAIGLKSAWDTVYAVLEIFTSYWILLHTTQATHLGLNLPHLMVN